MYVTRKQASDSYQILLVLYLIINNVIRAFTKSTNFAVVICRARKLSMNNRQICFFSEISSLSVSELKVEIDETVWSLSHGSQLIPIKREEIAYLYKASYIEKRRFFSLLGGYARKESIAHEIKRCEPRNKDTFDHVLILIQTSTEHPLIMSELQILDDITNGISSKAEIRWGVGTNDKLGDRIFLMVIYSK